MHSRCGADCHFPGDLHRLFVSSADNSSQGDGAQADQMEISYTPSIQAIDGVSDPGTNVQGISLADSNANYVPQLSEEGATQVGDAISAITANNKTGASVARGKGNEAKRTAIHDELRP